MLCILHLQVAELALVKLFENFSSEMLVSGMVTNMGAGTKLELWGEGKPTPTPQKQEGGDIDEVCEWLCLGRRESYK